MYLSRATLADLPANIARPRFDPAKVSAGIVHLGFGGFHRAHMARYTHDLMERRDDAAEWGIVGVGPLTADVRVRDSNWIGQRGDLRWRVLAGSARRDRRSSDSDR